MSDPRRFLVTGGAGFIGSHLVAALLSNGHRVVVLDDLSTGSPDNLAGGIADAEKIAGKSAAERCEFREASLLDQTALADAVAGVDAVLHQAAMSSVPRSFADPAGTMRANVEGTTCLLEACRKAGVRRIAMASSSSVYGDTPSLPKKESMVPGPLSPYALSKLAAERAAEIFARTYDLEVYALRYFNVFGPRQDPTSQYSAVIPKFVTNIAAGAAPVIYGDGLQSRDFTYVDNVVRANLLAVGAVEGAARDEATFTGAPGGGSCDVVNIACGSRYTLIDLVASLNEIMGTCAEPEFAAARPGDVRHSYASIARAERLLGYRPQGDFLEGLRLTVAALLHRPETVAWFPESARRGRPLASVPIEGAT